MSAAAGANGATTHLLEHEHHGVFGAFPGPGGVGGMGGAGFSLFHLKRSKVLVFLDPRA